MTELLMHPFSLGLELGLLATIVVAIVLWLSKRTLIKDNRTLREHLHTQTTINAKGNQNLIQELEQLKTRNENLRITIAALKNKTSKSELQTLYLYDKAIHLMYEKAPGFAPVWESILRDAEIERQKVYNGLIN